LKSFNEIKDAGSVVWAGVGAPLPFYGGLHIVSLPTYFRIFLRRPTGPYKLFTCSNKNTKNKQTDPYKTVGYIECRLLQTSDN
jgi:hypothetical protein